MTNIFEGILPKPKTDVGRGFHVILAVSIIVLGLWLIISKVDLIFDTGHPLGYLDDIGLALVLISLSLRLWKRGRDRVKKSKGALKRYAKEFSVTKALTSIRFWVSVTFIVIAFNYLFWVRDLIPDWLGAIGFIEDYAFILGSFVDMVKSWNKGGMR
jgi:uncharacterized membrane protein YkvA (DUF1232 family)